LTRALGAILLALVTTTATFADPKADDDDVAAKEDPAKQVVIVAATSTPGTTGRVDRLRHQLEARSMLKKVPDKVASLLDGRDVAVADLDSIRDAVANFDNAGALKKLDLEEKRILQNIASGDPVPSLALLSEWHGFLLAATGNADAAIQWFRAAFRFDPDWVVDRRQANNSIKEMVKKARREVTEQGYLRVDISPKDATFIVDGHDRHKAGDKMQLPLGLHLVVVTANGRAPYAELVDIAAGRPLKIQVTLSAETPADRAARVVTETVQAAPGTARLSAAAHLAQAINATRLLVVEDGADDHIVVRVYDTSARKFSKPINLAGTETASATARIVAAAL